MMKSAVITSFVCALLGYSSSIYPMEATIERSIQTSLKGVIVGVDVGGTNTDAVLLEQGRLVAKIKCPTTDDITSGILKAISGLFKQTPLLKERLTAVNIGTTHLLNALLQRKGLDKPLVVRLGAPATTAVPPAIGWDENIKQELIGNETYIVDGGFEFNGSPFKPLDINALQELASYSKAKKITSVAITGVFSNLNPSQEEQARDLFKKANPGIAVSSSHMMGEMGLLERENATILNACLASQMSTMKCALYKVLQQLDIKAPLYITYGDGTKEKLSNTSAVALRTLKSGPINSIKGAALLHEQEKDAVVIDIGGSTSDGGIILFGAPVNENSAFTIEGIRCNFSSARLHSFALGGGSSITLDANNRIKIGPASIGKDLYTKALAFGGDALTPTDIAYALGRLNIGTIDRETLRKKIAHRAQEHGANFIKRVDEALHAKLVEGIRCLIDPMEKVPQTLLLVGGGACLFDKVYLKHLLGNRLKNLIIPPSADIANALGAAASLISGTSVGIYDFAKISRDEAIEAATAQARALAIKKGACAEELTILPRREITLNYLQGDPKQVTVTAVGPDAGQPVYPSSVSEHSAVITEPMPSLQETSDYQLVHITKKLKEAENFIRQARTVRKPMPGSRLLTPSDINDLARGAGILGSGGGGNPEMGRLMALNALKMGYTISMIAREDLPDDAFVVDYGGVGSPEVSYERPASLLEGVLVIRAIEERAGKKVTALLIGEAAGSNATEPLLVAAILGIPVIDCDCMGRAFPQIDMTSCRILGTFTEHYAAISNGIQTHIIEAANACELEDKVREATVAMGGAVSCAMTSMSGAQVKKWTIKGTISLAQAIGKSLRNADKQPFSVSLKALNDVLAQTDYKEAQVVFTGKITDLERGISKGFSIGGFTVVDDREEKIDIGFQNENLIAREHESKKILALVPELITIVDKNNFQPICCEDLKFGQEIVVLKLAPPALMNTLDALKIVGPKAFEIEGILNLLTNRNKPQ